MHSVARSVCVIVCLSICLSASAQLGKKRTVVCDAQGRLHSLVVQMGSRQIGYQTFEDGQWSALESVSEGRYLLSPALAISEQLLVHAVWTDATAQNDGEVFYAARGPDGWSDPISLSEAQGFDWSARVVTTPDGAVHVVWQSCKGGLDADGNGVALQGQGTGMRYRRLQEGEWGEVMTITDEGDGLPTLITTPQGGLLAACSHGRIGKGGILLVPYQDGKWGAGAYVPEVPSPGDWPPGLALDGQGGLHLLYSPFASLGILYAQRTGNTWGPAGEVGKEMGLGLHGLMGAPDGSVHIIRPVAMPDRGRVLAHARFANGQWEPATSLSKSDFMSFVDLVCAPDGTVHIIAGDRPTHYRLRDGTWTKIQ